MIFTTFENSLRTLSFSCLFLTMLFYWIKAGFFQIKKTTKFEDIALLICNFVLISILLIRWIESNHFPLSNLYESLIFLSWSLLSFLLILQIKTKELFIGTIITPIVLFIATFATFSLPVEMQKASALVPALQSNWLMMHVTIMMLSYAALLFGSLFAITFLVIDATLGKIDIVEQSATTLATQYENVNNQNEIRDSSIPISTNSLNFVQQPQISTMENSSFTTKIKLTTTLDNFSYRTIGVGFPLLTIGILSGAVWANETWGSYWN